MELREYNIPAALIKSGEEGSIVLTAGQKLRVDAPRGKDIIDVACPTGKRWTARVIVEIREESV
jgi:hypothetical protein